MMTNNEKFEAIKQKVQSIVENNSALEVTNETDLSFGGIYMLYVNDFSDEKVIPFYIGKTENFQKRHKEHFSELLEFNRYNYDEYRYNFIRPSYSSGVVSRFEGMFKMCKIFKYMLEHGCKLKDFRMVILEKNESENLDDLEQQYFQEYEPAFFGFNQMNTVTEWAKCAKQEPDKYLAYVEADGRKCAENIKYGYTLFNYLHAFPKMRREHYPEALNELIVSLKNKFYDQTRAESIASLYTKANESNSSLAEKRKILIRKLTPIFKAFFEENGLKSSDKLKVAREIALEPDEKKMNQFKRYVSRYSSEQGDIIERLFSNPVVVDCRQRYSQEKELSEKLQDEYFEKKYQFKLEEFELIFPNIKFDSFALGDMYSPFVFPDVDGDNVCQINIEYTCERGNWERGTTPEELIVAFKITKGGVVTEDIVSLPYSYSDISVNIEYKTGLNEKVLERIKKSRIEKVFKYISKLIDSDTTILICSRTSGWKSKLNSSMNLMAIQNTLLREKIKQVIR